MVRGDLKKYIFFKYNIEYIYIDFDFGGNRRDVNTIKSKIHIYNTF